MQSCSGLENASAVARAFSIGKNEAGAMACLKLHVSDPIVANLTEAVRLRGMRAVHQSRADSSWGLQSRVHQRADKFESWNVQLTNGDDDVLVSWLVVCSSVLALIAFLQSAVPAHSLGQFVLGTNHGRLRQIPRPPSGRRSASRMPPCCMRSRAASFISEV